MEEPRTSELCSGAQGSLAQTSTKRGIGTISAAAVQWALLRGEDGRCLREKAEGVAFLGRRWAKRGLYYLSLRAGLIREPLQGGRWPLSGA